MTTLELAGGTLTAAAADAPEPRVAEGVIVPWDRPGRTSLGIKTIRRGALRLVAEAPVIGLYGHNRDASVSRLLEAEDRPDGLWGRLRIADTPAGNLLLAEIRAGVREGLSVELSELEFDPHDSDVLTSGRLDAVAHVPLPAFDSARVHALAATLNTPDGEPFVTEPAPPAPAADLAAQLAAMTAKLDALTAAQAAPSAAQVLSTAGLPGPTGGAPADTVDRLATLTAAVATEAATPEMKAALADITNTGLSLFQKPAGAIGEELWRGAGYTRQFVPLMTQQTLTDWKFGGWRWVQGPVVDDYAGDKTEVPTNTVSVEPVEGTAQRVAGAWDIDRKFRDFGDAAFWAGFYRLLAESYAEKTDEIAAAAIIDAARSTAVNANVPAAYAVAGNAQPDLLRAAAVGNAILADTPNVRRPADFVLMNPADWLSLLDIAQLDAPQFLSIFGVRPENFKRHPLVPAGAVIMGVTPAISFFELGGGSPIRVEALDVPRAGVDVGVYGYCGTLVNRPGGIISIPIGPETTTEPA